MNATKTQTLDFTAYAEQCRALTSGELVAALLDVRRTLPYADMLDREEGGARGGYYRDQSSVLRAEIAVRGLLVPA